ncbi:protein-L-isoaspartate O-methyltransferase [Sphingomonas oleivorans]|uniref:Protein-L-isoaspartate O-methyltransferase n=1 Tax=Sphingomonas oleivorans TaxID=1735121 RepID=A0A2T5FVK7_9SPHN|nr:protein-L-isoaspartate O-methyltransferase [Sphingomonas oleivorans]PTQ09807.1 protein-L-isoaspartate O-methyltransferase [Sphingomonas oleivorans]
MGLAEVTDQSFDAMRRAMVASQLRTTAVSDPRVIAAMGEVPRERHVPRSRSALAYVDTAVPLGGGRALNAPMVTGRLLTEAQVAPEDRVLLVGAATGYAAALLSLLAGSVVALEEDAALLATARDAGVPANVEFVEGPLAEGWPAKAPYDLIFVDGAIETIPDALIAQLADDGRLAAAIVERGVTRLGIGRRAGEGFGFTPFADAEAVSLPGFAKPPQFVF